MSPVITGNAHAAANGGADGSTCACYSGHRCTPCRRKHHLSNRLIRYAWRDDPNTAGARYARSHLTVDEQTDRRDHAWTARDLYDIWIDRERYTQTWWRLHWPAYWDRQTQIVERHCRPSVEDVRGWAAFRGKDVTVGGKTGDAFTDEHGHPVNTSTCTAPLAACEEPAFVFARSLSTRLDQVDLARPLVHFHRRVNTNEPEALHGAEELDLFSAVGL